MFMVCRAAFASPTDNGPLTNRTVNLHMETVMHLQHLPGSMLYFIQAVTHGFAFWAIRRNQHPPAQVYLASCVVYVALGILFCSPLE